MKENFLYGDKKINAKSCTGEKLGNCAKRKQSCCSIQRRQEEMVDFPLQLSIPEVEISKHSCKGKLALQTKAHLH